MSGERVGFDKKIICGRPADVQVNSRVAVTPAQHHLVRSAIAFWMERGRWPASFELAAYADRSCPDVWAELKTLERLGVVQWRQTVRILREPDGFFLAVNTERPALSEPSRDGEPVANMYDASGVAGSVAR